ncbi:MAG: 30S ribosome-binding factor RbfA [Lachnospiraceae bacterium]|jgi:ribosome-binding factor A|nr:30S ribosome-binding factor RbfA [Lachnospiraceae bacterium]MBR2532238.1 30S ribosome-binding factor RbfA [Lachnospiraceae bacterium]
MKKGSIKNNRINGEVLRELTSIIRDDVKDPRIDPLITVTRVEVTPDLQYCKCFVSSLGSDDTLKESIEGLKNAGGYIRRELARRVNLRKTPELQFVPDRSMEYAMEMSMKIEALAKAGGMSSDDSAADEEPDLEM